MKAIAYSALPRPSASRSLSTVAWITVDFDEVAKGLLARPKAFSLKSKDASQEERYRSLFLRLSNGAHASLTQWEDKPERVELDLEIVDQEFVYEDECAEVISELNIESSKVKKLRGNLKWLSSRNVKKVPSESPELPEDWWNHVKVLPHDKS